MTISEVIACVELVIIGIMIICFAIYRQYKNRVLADRLSSEKSYRNNRISELEDKVTGLVTEIYRLRGWSKEDFKKSDKELLK